METENPKVGWDEYSECMERALRIEFMAAQSVGGLRRKLVRKGFDEAIVTRVIGELIKVGELDDKRFAGARVRRKLARGYGPFAMRAELREKGVERELSETLVGEVDEKELIRQAARVLQLYEPKRDEQSRHFQERRRTALARRGFTFDTIRKAEELLVQGEEDDPA